MGLLYGFFVDSCLLGPVFFLSLFWMKAWFSLKIILLRDSIVWGLDKAGCYSRKHMEAIWYKQKIPKKVKRVHVVRSLEGNKHILYDSKKISSYSNISKLANFGRTVPPFLLSILNQAIEGFAFEGLYNAIKTGKASHEPFKIGDCYNTILQTEKYTW